MEQVAARISAVIRAAGLNGMHVQNRLTDDADKLRKLIANGGQVLVCGSSAMSASVRLALDAILAPLGINVQALKAGGRFREDVF